jgi:hypothetical protein
MTHSLEPSGAFGSDASSSNAPRWRWRLEDATGTEVRPVGLGAAPDFPSQSDAESWVGEVWRDLLEVGVDQVTLLEGDREVYGPMSLHTAP